MSLSREVSVATGLATAVLVYAIYSNMTPTLADIRVSRSNDSELASAEKTGAWTAAATVAAISLITRDATVFVIGGATVLALSWTHKYANGHDPMSAASGVLPSSRQTLTEAMTGGSTDTTGYTPSA
jgi:hypothetical protein